jgi:hypothetical protein
MADATLLRPTKVKQIPAFFFGLAWLLEAMACRRTWLHHQSLVSAQAATPSSKPAITIVCFLIVAASSFICTSSKKKN